MSGVLVANITKFALELSDRKEYGNWLKVGVFHRFSELFFGSVNKKNCLTVHLCSRTIEIWCEMYFRNNFISMSQWNIITSIFIAWFVHCTQMYYTYFSLGHWDNALAIYLIVFSLSFLSWCADNSRFICSI